MKHPGPVRLVRRIQASVGDTGLMTRQDGSTPASPPPSPRPPRPGLERPSIIVNAGLSKPNATAFTDADHNHIRRLGVEYRRRVPRNVVCGDALKALDDQQAYVEVTGPAAAASSAPPTGPTATSTSSCRCTFLGDK